MIPFFSSIKNTANFAIIRDTLPTIVGGQQTHVIKDPLPGAPNLMQNGGFDNLDTDGKVAGWTVQSSMWDSGVVSIATESGRGNIVKLASAEKNTNPALSYVARDVTPGAEYQVSALLKTVAVLNSGPAFKAEFYYNSTFVSESLGRYFGSTNGQWEQVADQLVIPRGANRVRIYARLYGAGEVYFDDIACYQTESPAYMMNFRTSVFNYTEWDTGFASVGLNSDVYEPQSGEMVAFQITDGSTVLDSYVTEPAEQMTYYFDTSVLEEKKKAYTLSAIYKDADGNALQTVSDLVYRHDRPTHLTADGLFIKHNGEVLRPVIGYHVYQKDFDKCVEAGITVVQSDNSSFTNGANSGNIPKLLEYLDEAQNRGLMVLVVLYAGGNAGGENMLARTRACVEAVKDHPAVFGYAVMDEPFAHFVPHNQVYTMLKAAYKAIREIDPDHVVYICENRPVHYWQTLSSVDVMAHDPYPGNQYPKESHVYDRITNAKKEPLGQLKSIYFISQAWPLQGYTPTANDMYQMFYQAMFAGADGIGYYDVSSFSNGPSLWDRGDLYEGVKQIKAEYEDAYKAFVTGEYETLCEKRNSTESSILYKAYVKEGDVHIVALNLASASGFVNIPLLGRSVRIEVPAGEAVRYVFQAMSSIAFYNQGGEDVLSFSRGDTVYAECGTEKDAMLAIALYQVKGGIKTLIEVKTARETGAYTDGPLVTGGIKVPGAEADYALEAFLWDADMMPKQSKTAIKYLK